MTITEFLLVAIDSDEAVARETLASNGLLVWGGENVGIAGPVDGPSGYMSIVIDPARVLAECAAKRAIVDRCAAVDYAMPSTHLADGVLRHLASVYADRDGYDEAWRP